MSISLQFCLCVFLPHDASHVTDSWDLSKCLKGSSWFLEWNLPSFSAASCCKGIHVPENKGLFPTTLRKLCELNCFYAFVVTTQAFSTHRCSPMVWIEFGRIFIAFWIVSDVESARLYTNLTEIMKLRFSESSEKSYILIPLNRFILDITGSEVYNLLFLLCCFLLYSGEMSLGWVGRLS